MRISRIVEIPMGHRLQAHPGRCKHVHGHNYQVEVSLTGPVDPVSGMLIDFSDLKKGMHQILDAYDHAMVLEIDDPYVDEIGKATDRLILINEPPTAEILARLWHQEFREIFDAFEVTVLVKETKDTAAIALFSVGRIEVNFSRYTDNRP